MLVLLFYYFSSMDNKDSYFVIGVMSGTSLDGIDLCYAQFEFSNTWTFKILKSETIPYSNDWIKKLKNAISFDGIAVVLLNEDYTDYLGKVINRFIETKQIKLIDAVCSHGHTIFHQPENQYTLQIGNLAKIASIIGQTVVCDFRIQDVAFGGEGAPLVPIGDKLLFNEFDFCLNLGGFANASYEFNNQRIAYDICPVNIVLNHYVKILGFDYDDKGEIALSGTVNQALLNALNDLEFYKKGHPKSLGLEWVQSEIIPLIDAFNLEIKNILRTFVEHAAFQIAQEINKLGIVKLFFTGGGVYNLLLIERIADYSKSEITIPSKEIIEYKEALIFGLLGILKLRNEVNCLSSVTGAKVNHSSGEIFLP